MYIPPTINNNTIKTYEQTIKKTKNQINSGDFVSWNKNLLKSLQELCVQTIADNWREKPVLDEIKIPNDKLHLLNILPTNLELEITVPAIEDDIYWKRCFTEKWPKKAFVKSLTKNDDSNLIYDNNEPEFESNCKANNCWKRFYLEMFVKDYLEKMKPEEYDPEKMKELIDLCKLYVKSLQIDEFQYSELSGTHIPISSIIAGFTELSELCICFKQSYVKNTFSRGSMKLNINDIKLLAKGLEKCNLKIFRIINSDINDDKCVILTKALLNHNNLEVIEFSHCKISDEGLTALSKFCTEKPTVKQLILPNNKIGSEGVEVLAYAVCHPSNNIETINLRLNQIGEKGGNLLMQALHKGSNSVKSLNLSGCNLSKNNITIGDMLKRNTTLEELNLANNKLEEEIGEIILDALKCNSTIRKLDVRMCQISSKTELKILKEVSEIRAIQQGIISVPSRETLDSSFQISEELLLKFNNILV